MAITRLGHIKEGLPGKMHQGIKNCINYIFNPLKTEGFKWIGANNVILYGQNRTEDAYEQFMATKNMYNKADGRQAYHYKLSFSDDDVVSPELALEITQEFCEKYLGEYEAVYSVHTNTDHIHSHIVFNSVNAMSGFKYHYKNGDWRKYIQPIVNDICLRYHLSYIELATSKEEALSNKKEKKRMYRTYGQWLNSLDKEDREKKTHKPYYSYSMIRKDIDEVCSLATDFNEFKLLMKNRSYDVISNDKSKHISIMAPGRTKAVRTYQLTPDKNTYTTENIFKMINGTYKPLDKKMVYEKLYEDFKVFLSTDRIDIITKKRKSNLEFSKQEEAVRMVVSKKFNSLDDVKNYLTYINQADKELNIIKKNAKVHIENYDVYCDEMDRLITLVPKIKEYYINGSNYDAYIEGKDIYEKMKIKGVSPLLLYRQKNNAQELIYNIDSFKKKLYVDKILCNRIISSDTVGFVKTHTKGKKTDV